MPNAACPFSLVTAAWNRLPRQGAPPAAWQLLSYCDLHCEAGSLHFAENRGVDDRGSHHWPSPLAARREANTLNPRKGVRCILNGPGEPIMEMLAQRSALYIALMIAPGVPLLSAQGTSSGAANEIHDGASGIGRCKLVVAEALIKARLPGIECDAEIIPLRQDYGPLLSVPGSRVSAKGERVLIKLKVGDHVLAEKSWATSFPSIIPDTDPKNIIMPGGGTLEFVPAEVCVEDLLIELFRLTNFAPEDLAALARSSVAEVRIGAAANLRDQALLAQLAADTDYRVRNAAAGHLTDQGVLGRLATNDTEVSVRINAIGGLTEQRVLLRLALEDKEYNVRKAAVLRLTDQAALLKIALEHSNPGTSLVAAERISDQAALARIVSESKDFFVRIATVKSITDQSVLERLSTQDSEAQIRKAAVVKLRDQAIIAKVAVEDKDGSVRQTAIRELTDEFVLSKLAADNSNQDVRQAAAARLSSIRSK